MRRAVRGAAVAAAAVVAFVAVAGGGCTVGPAAHRVEGEADPARPGPVPAPAPTPAPTPTRSVPAAHGSADVTVAVDLSHVLSDACCLAELPGGDLLVGTRDAGRVHRLDPYHPHTLTEVGVVWEVALDPANVLLALAVDPDQPGRIYAAYAQASSITVASHAYNPSAPPGQQLGVYPNAFLRDVPVDPDPDPDPGAEALAVLAFGPDGCLYVATGDAGRPALAWDRESTAGKILRLTPFGDVPADAPLPGSPVHALGLRQPTGLAWDDAGRLWVADSGGVGAVVVPGQAPVPVWGPGGGGDQGAGLVHAAGCLWLPGGEAAGGLWRVPLGAGPALASAPELVPVPVDLPDSAPEVFASVNSLWTVTAAGQLSRLALR
ncbi:PQQ-dependent sugar dehydrogenase [Streptomyces sp. 4N509B]|uniref:PQQ-dependent sugar dehydrogenase n=1 Tax=Streptomyces sp. 4N509B TaxID=3457413 RepID=UPI003FD2EED3